jgi:hypothetical protein
MNTDNEPLTFPPQTLPATAPGDTVLLRRPGQAIWAGAARAVMITRLLHPIRHRFT